MSSADASSNPEGAAGGDGGDGSSKDNGKTGRAKKISSTPRQSAAVLLQLKVIRKALVRLMTERNQLDDVKNHLQTSAEDLEREIARVSKMRDIAQEASNFQHGRPHETVMQFLTSLTSGMDEGGPLPGSSAAITDGTSTSPTNLQNLTNDFLFGMQSSNDPAIPMMDDTGSTGFEGIDYFSNIINDLGIETISHDIVQQTVRDMKIEDNSGEDGGDEDHY